MILLVAGTRPNFMKIAPVYRALSARKLDTRVLHTGQHFDATMSDVFFRDLGLPTPWITLKGGGGSHAEQTASILVGIEKALLQERPKVVIVVGDVTSTLSASLAASKLGIPVVHVESGLRSRDWTMPEEINRIVTDQLSDLLLTPSPDAAPNLRAEGIPEERIVFVGNVMIDSLHWALRKTTDAVTRFKLKAGEYALVTLHRPANVDTEEALKTTLDAVNAVAKHLPVLFPVHPRTTARVHSLGLSERLTKTPNLTTIEPLGYDDFITVMSKAKLVATDSGGIQEETTALGIPCLTLRGGTERPITVTEGTNEVVGLDPVKIDNAAKAIVAGQGKKGRVPNGWDGKAGERVADAIEAFLGGKPPPRTSGPRA